MNQKRVFKYGEEKLFNLKPVLNTYGKRKVLEISRTKLVIALTVFCIITPMTNWLFVFFKYVKPIRFVYYQT